MARIRQENRRAKCFLSTKVQGGTQGQPSSRRKGQDLYSVFPSYSGEVGSAGCPAPTLRQQRPPKERKWQTRADRWGRSGREEPPQCHHTQHGRESCEYSIQAGDCVGGSGILWVLLLLFSSPPADAPRGEAPDPLTQRVRGSLSHQSPPAFLSRGVRATPKFLFENHSCVQCCLSECNKSILYESSGICLDPGESDEAKSRDWGSMDHLI